MNKLENQKFFKEKCYNLLSLSNNDKIKEYINSLVDVDRTNALYYLYNMIFDNLLIENLPLLKYMENDKDNAFSKLLLTALRSSKSNQEKIIFLKNVNKFINLLDFLNNDKQGLFGLNENTYEILFHVLDIKQLNYKTKLNFLLNFYLECKDDLIGKFNIYFKNDEYPKEVLNLTHIFFPKIGLRGKEEKLHQILQNSLNTKDLKNEYIEKLFEYNKDNKFLAFKIINKAFINGFFSDKKHLNNIQVINSIVKMTKLDNNFIEKFNTYYVKNNNLKNGTTFLRLILKYKNEELFNYISERKLLGPNFLKYKLLQDEKNKGNFLAIKIENYLFCQKLDNKLIKNKEIKIKIKI